MRRGSWEIVSLWTIGFDVPTGRTSGGCMQWGVVSTDQKCEIKFMLRRNRFGKWAWICPGLEEQVRARP